MDLGQPDDLMAGIGFGKYSARQVLGRLTPAVEQPSRFGEEEKPGGISSVVRRVFGGDTTLYAWLARATCWFTGRDVAIRFSEKPLSDT